MKNIKKLTERQQIQIWLKESTILDDSDKTVSDIYSIAMKHKETHSDWNFQQLYAYAYIIYVNNILSEMGNL